MRGVRVAFEAARQSVRRIMCFKYIVCYMPTVRLWLRAAGRFVEARP